MKKTGLLIAALTLILDQAVKWAVMGPVFGLRYLDAAMLGQWRQPIEVTGFFNLTTVWNRGVSFGMLAHSAEWGRWGLVALSVVISIGLLSWLWRCGKPLLASALGLIVGGALGNVVDRAVYGAVYDFLDFHAFGYHWPSFNVADSAISIGVLLLLLDGLFARGSEHK